MTKITLTPEDKAKLEMQHKQERDVRICDRIKAVLLRSEGWKIDNIAQALRIHEETVREHIKLWTTEDRLNPLNGGSKSKLSKKDANALEAHITNKTYVKVIDICNYVCKTYGASYTVSGMTKWLLAHGFSYKQPKSIPAKVNLQSQEEFTEKYIELASSIKDNETLVFTDAVHPTMATKISYGWIKKGTEKPINQTASRTRVNVIGGIELSTMNVVTTRPETVNAETTIEFLKKLKEAYCASSKLHVILDQSGYNRSKDVRAFAEKEGIELHYLPPYSPNLNPIERLWKVMNEKVRNNRFFKSAKDFKEAIANFFEKDLPIIAPTLRDRINDNFQVLKPVV